MNANDLTEQQLDEICEYLMVGTPWDYIQDVYQLTERELRLALMTRIKPPRYSKTAKPRRLDAQLTEADSSKPARIRKHGRHWILTFQDTQFRIVAESYLQAIIWADYMTRKVAA